MSEKDVKKSINAAAVAHLSTLPPSNGPHFGDLQFPLCQSSVVVYMRKRIVKDSRKPHTNRVLFRFHEVLFLFRVSFSIHIGFFFYQ